MELSLTPGELGRLENPSLLDGLLSSTAPASFWTWGVLIFAAVTSALAVAAAGILLSKLQTSRFRRRITMVRHLSFCSSGEDDDDSSVSSSDTDEDDEEETDEMGESDEEEDESGDFRGVKVNGMENFTFSSFSLADLVGGMGVVKAWDGMGLGLDRSRGAISFFDMSRGEILRSFNGGGTAETRGVDLASPAEIVSAEDEASGAVVRVWDVRERVEKPAATARPLLRRRIAGIRAREEKVFVGDEGGEIAPVDLRKLAQVEGGEGSGTWWRSAATCLKLLSPRLENA